MQKLNEFITMNQEAFKDLCDEITDKDQIDQAVAVETDMPEDTYYQALAYLHHILHQEQENISSRLGRRDSSPFGDNFGKDTTNAQSRLAEKFNKTMAALGDPPQPKQQENA